MRQQTGIAGWSEFGFGQLLIDHQEVPVLGLQRQSGSVQPPTTSGHALTTARQIELGSVTMRQLGVHVGERVRVGTAKQPVARTLTVVGVVTLPSMGTVLTDHVSLGRGAMLEDSALLAVQGLPPFTQATFYKGAGLSSPSYPSAVAIDATSAVAARRAVASILRAEPDQTPGGMYSLYPQQGAQVVDLHQMGALPISIALGVALAAVLALALTIVASVRQRRRELALLKAVGMRRGQLRAVVASQTSTVLAVAVLIGIPLGVAAGRWAWTAFAREIGVVPAPVLPAAKIALGVLALLVVVTCWRPGPRPSQHGPRWLASYGRSSATGGRQATGTAVPSRVPCPVTIGLASDLAFPSFPPGFARGGECCLPAEVVPPHLPGSSRRRHNDGMGLAWYAARATWRRSWRMTLLIALIGGLLGAVALGALAGAQRTDSAYGRYLRSVNASDVSVDIPGPILPLIHDVEAEPDVLSSAAWIGLDAEPVIKGKIEPAFQTDAIAGSLDGEFYRQDKLTVLAGKLPPASSTGELILTPQLAGHFHLTVGDRMTWQFYRPLANGGDSPATRTAFTVAAIADVSPALVDDFDNVETAILPPAATARYLNGGEWSFGWASLRLRNGDAGVHVLQQELRQLAAAAQHEYNNFPFTFAIRRLAVVQHEAQQAIEPQAIALAVLGVLAVIALLALMTQGLAQLLTRSASDAQALRAMGASRAAAATTTAAWGAVAVAGAVLLSVGGAIAVSPLAPIGPVRLFDPVKGVQADWLVLGGGGAILLILLTAVLAWLAWRAVRQESELPSARSSALVGAVTRAGLPVTVIAGIRHALERGSGRLRAPVRATLTGSVVAVTALVAALVFGASLTGLVSHPAEYGWNWNLLIQSQGGWGSWPPGALDKPLAGQPGVIGWSELGFGQLSIRGAEVPAMGVLQHSGEHPVEPPTTSGHPLSGQNQIELGSTTMRQLGLHLGDKLRLGRDPQPLTVVGVVTLPSFGVALTDHVSLGRGAMMEWTTLMRRARPANRPD